MPEQKKPSGRTSYDAEKKIASVSDGWRSRLMGGSEDPKPSIANVLIALQHAPEWRGVLRFDASSLCIMTGARPPFEGASDPPARWTDEDDTWAMAWFHHQGIPVGIDAIRQGVQAIAHRNTFHPIKDYLESLKWDKDERMDYFVPLYLGAEPSAYAVAVGVKWLIGAVARIFEPGCKHDCCLILEGDQGLLKGSALKTLVGAKWFSDSMSDLGGKDSLLQMRGKWVFEFSDLAPMKGMDIDRLKAFISRTEDRFRPPYGRYVIDVPRECVFAGTVNLETYLKDETGARRFWPVRCGTVDLKALKRDRDQIWAEAVARYKDGEKWWLQDKGLIAAAEEEARKRYSGDPWDEKISRWIDDHEHETVSISEILGYCLGKKKEDWTQSDQNRIARSLRSMGWKRFQKRTAAGRHEWRYRSDRNQTETSG